MSTDYQPSTIDYQSTGAFIALVTDYIAGAAALDGLYAFAPDAGGLEEAITARAGQPVNRTLLAATLRRQYAEFDEAENALSYRQIDALKSESTFTICAAHQPNLATGYLYFVYKILHAVKLADVLNRQRPDKHFVPVYYMGSEDNDLQELGVFRYGEKKFAWNGAGQTGAVGRMSTEGIAAILGELFSIAGPPGPHLDALREIFETAYLKHETIGTATRYLVHRLFASYGLLVLDPDDADLKQSFIPVMREELLQQNAAQIIVPTQQRLEAAGYKAQAHARPINLFYLHENIRERMEPEGDEFIIVNTPLRFTKTELLEALEIYPERFSPNVILRPLFQEAILPDVAFIGGGSEVAYWLQLRDLFQHHGVFFPQVLLRQSVLWIDGATARNKARLQIGDAQLFRTEHELHRLLIIAGNPDLQLETEKKAVADMLRVVEEKAASLHPTLRHSAKAAAAKMLRQLDVLESKLLRAKKRQASVFTNRISLLKRNLFPGGTLQERYENFVPYFISLGPAFFDTLLESIEPLASRFLIIAEQNKTHNP